MVQGALAWSVFGVMAAAVAMLVGVLTTLVVHVMSRIGARFDAIDARFDAIDARFDAIGARFDAMGREIRESADQVRADLRREIQDSADRLRGELASKADLRAVKDEVLERIDLLAGRVTQLESR